MLTGADNIFASNLHLASDLIVTTSEDFSIQSQWLQNGARLRAIAHSAEVPSAQIKSAILLAGLHADGVTSVVETTQTRDHTERAFEAFGVTVGRDASGVSVAGGQRLSGRALSIPGDFSSAAYWMVAAAGTAGSRG